MNYILPRVLRVVMHIFSIGSIPYSWYFKIRFSHKPNRIPPITNKILEIPAVKLADMIRLKQVNYKTTIKIPTLLLYYFFFYICIRVYRSQALK